MKFSSRTMTDADWSRTRFFKAAEFKQPLKMGYEFIQWLERVRAAADVPMTITSSYRSAEYNEDVGGADDSAHTDVPCNAVDIGMRPRKEDPNWNYSRFQIIGSAMDMGCKRIGSYENGSVHLDMTHDKRPAPRLWRVVRGK